MIWCISIKGRGSRIRFWGAGPHCGKWDAPGCIWLFQRSFLGWCIRVELQSGKVVFCVFYTVFVFVFVLVWCVWGWITGEMIPNQEGSRCGPIYPPLMRWVERPRGKAPTGGLIIPRPTNTHQWWMINPFSISTFLLILRHQGDIKEIDLIGGPHALGSSGQRPRRP